MTRPASGAIIGIAFLLIVVIIACTIQIAINKQRAADRIYRDRCYAAALADKDARLEMLDYQIDNNFLSFADSIASKEYIDFLEEKAYSACDEPR